MKLIRYQDVDSYVEARDRVVKAATVVADRYNTDPGDPVEDLKLDSDAMSELSDAVDALRSVHEDRGVRDPGTPGEQEAGPQPSLGESGAD